MNMSITQGGSMCRWLNQMTPREHREMHEGREYSEQQLEARRPQA